MKKLPVCWLTTHGHIQGIPNFLGLGHGENAGAHGQDASGGDVPRPAPRAWCDKSRVHANIIRFGVTKLLFNIFILQSAAPPDPATGPCVEVF